MSPERQPATLKQILGCWAHERWKTELVLQAPRLAAACGLDWLDLCNRGERITRTPDGRGRRCEWTGTSFLTVCRVFPHVGGRLMARCLHEWPFEFTGNSGALTASNPECSVILAVRGRDRKAQLSLTLAALMAQRHCRIEIFVIEQSWNAELEGEVPPGVRYRFARSTHPDMPFNKAWALNVGARLARAPLLVFHDGDMVVPATYCRTLVDVMAVGFDAALLPRLVFYLSEDDSRTLNETRSLESVQAVEQVMQNCPGSSLAVTRAAYESVGGHDEGFFGWGGEDNELLDRARTLLRVYPGAFVPFVHLWHAPAPGKNKDHNVTYTNERLMKPANERAGELSSRPWGSAEPSVKWEVPT